MNANTIVEVFRNEFGRIEVFVPEQPKREDYPYRNSDQDVRGVVIDTLRKWDGIDA